MSAGEGARAQALDPELAAALGRDSMSGLSRLLAHVPRGEVIPAQEIGAIVYLIEHANRVGDGGEA